MLRRLALGAVVLALLAVGCGLFKPRDPVKSPGGPSFCSLCLDRTGVDNVEGNVQLTYGLDSCLTCYTDGLDPSFAFHPDPTDSFQSPPKMFLNWNYDIEFQVASAISSDTTTVTAVFDGEYASPTKDPQTEIRRYYYHVTVRSSTDSVRYQGKADITYRENNGFWRITTWVDQRDGSGLPTWGLLRGNKRLELGI